MADPWFYNRRFIQDSSDYLYGKVIDIGCGTAKYRNIILGFPGVKELVGLDFIGGKGVDIVADLNRELPIADAEYDAAICISVLEHLLEPDLALREISRILRPGAHLLLSTPWVYPYHAVPEDYYRFSKKALEHLCRKNGFEIVLFSSTGGKWRVLLVFLNLWLSPPRVLFRVLEKLLCCFDTKRKNETKLRPNTPSHRLIARKRGK